MIRVRGKHNTAVCYCTELEELAESQIRSVCDQAFFADSKIRIMPDVHAGLGCTIGTTMTISDKIVPGMVGVDIGCGVETIRLQETKVDFGQLDSLIRERIPCGRDVRETEHPFLDLIDLTELRCAAEVNLTRARYSIGTLGGGNHFIELGRGDSGALYLTIHSGSRHLGNEVARYYQAQGRLAPGMPKDLVYVEGRLFDDYIHDMKIIQRFAELNRQAMAEVILKGIDWSEEIAFTTIHNYIDTDAMILRKGAVSAKAGEMLLIPINMRDGSLICRGRGNEDWNCSAPHGAGRLMSRRAAFRKLSMDQYRSEMTDIYTTCVTPDTLDESPMAYKSVEEITAQIAPTAEILERVKPLYNFKAAE
ncbi:MAG TPA: RtcB family protein [Clostridiales bacterium]|jgi:RNA-splicing ligase RtcB|nr:RtcB family protein [Bacteroidales bacterium]HHX13474.1 RtcB family protein [Clostridiales bacterium]